MEIASSLAELIPRNDHKGRSRAARLHLVIVWSKAARDLVIARSIAVAMRRGDLLIPFVRVEAICALSVDKRDGYKQRQATLWGTS